ncbi:hypothetical protein GQ457_03G011520 [Hibiscus cannabinus]
MSLPHVQFVPTRSTRVTCTDTTGRSALNREKHVIDYVEFTLAKLAMSSRRSTRVLPSRGQDRGHSALTHKNPPPPPAPIKNHDELPHDDEVFNAKGHQFGNENLPAQ